MSLDEYFGGWLNVIDSYKLDRVVKELNTLNTSLLCPNYKDIFKVFNICPYNECKVIFLAQDPYPQKDVATGIAFGNNTDELSPSLRVLKEGCIDYSIPHGPIEFDNTLESWCKQGVLMLNSALTCEVNKVNSHINMWRSFISKLLTNISKYNTGIIYVLAGIRAKTFKPYINKDFNDIIEVEHPAYFARMNIPFPHKVFSDIDKLLKLKYNATIEWYKEY